MPDIQKISINGSCHFDETSSKVFFIFFHSRQGKVIANRIIEKKITNALKFKENNLEAETTQELQDLIENLFESYFKQMAAKTLNKTPTEFIFLSDCNLGFPNTHDCCDFLSDRSIFLDKIKKYFPSLNNAYIKRFFFSSSEDVVAHAKKNLDSSRQSEPFMLVGNCFFIDRACMKFSKDADCELKNIINNNDYSARFYSSKQSHSDDVIADQSLSVAAGMPTNTSSCEQLDSLATKSQSDKSPKFFRCYERFFCFARNRVYIDGNADHAAQPGKGMS